MVKPLKNNYVDKNANTTNQNSDQTQAVITASYNNLKLVSNNHLKPSKNLNNYDNENNIIYVQTQTMTVKTDRKITTDGFGFRNYNDNYKQNSSKYHTYPTMNSPTPNCSNDDGLNPNSYYPNNKNGNKTAKSMNTSFSNCNSQNTKQNNDEKKDTKTNILTLNSTDNNA